MPTFAEGDRVTDGLRTGIVDRILAPDRRGLAGAKCVDVFVRWDDGGPPSPANPNDLRHEPDWRDGRP